MKALLTAGGHMKRRALMFLLLFLVWGYSMNCSGETRKELYDDGKVKSLHPYNNDGLLDGVVKKYYPSGRIQSEETYRKNIKDGIAKEYFENGKIMKQQKIKDGNLDGVFKEFYENGRLKAELNYEAGKREGSYSIYFENGKVNQKGRYKNDKLEGVCKEYQENGTIKGEAVFKDGVLVSEICYDTQGNMVECSQGK